MGRDWARAPNEAGAGGPASRPAAAARPWTACEHAKPLLAVARAWIQGCSKRWLLLPRAPLTRPATHPTQPRWLVGLTEVYRASWYGRGEASAHAPLARAAAPLTLSRVLSSSSHPMAAVCVCVLCCECGERKAELRLGAPAWR